MKYHGLKIIIIIINIHCLSVVARPVYVLTFFAERVINHWNSLPDSVNFSSFYSFKRSVQSINFANLRFLLHLLACG